MLKTIATNVVVSKGFNGSDALKFSEKGDSVRFRIGQKVYDSRVEGNHRWLNLAAKAFGDVCERISKMKIKEGSFINIIGRLDEEVWPDQTTGAERRQNVIIIEDIEYASSAKSGDSQNTGGNQAGGQNQGGAQNGRQGQENGGPYYQQASAYQGQVPQMQQGNRMQQGQVPQMHPQMPGMPQMAPAARTAPAQVPPQQMAPGQMYGQAPAGQMNGQAPRQQDPAAYEGFNGFEAYSGNNLFVG